MAPSTLIMSTVISLLNRGNPLQAEFFPPLEGQFEIGLLSIHTRNIVPNISSKNNMFYYEFENNTHFVEVAEGYYTLPQLAQFLNFHLMNKHYNEYKKLTQKQSQSMGYGLIKIDMDLGLERVQLICGFPVPVSGDRSLMPALGFEGHTLTSLRTNVAERKMQFYSDNIIRVNCSDVRGGYQNGVRSNTIYEFDCIQKPGERFVEKPSIITYFPVSDRSSLRQVRVELVDKDNRPLNLLRELTLVRLHIRHGSGI